MKVIRSLAIVFQKLVAVGFSFIWFEVRFFNFATNEANCDWLKLILNMAHFNINNYQNKIINTLMVFALRSQQVQELEDSINITYGILDSISQILGIENVPVTRITTMLGNSIKKKWKWYCEHCQKTHNFMWKTKNYLKKTLMVLKKYIQIFQRKGKKKDLLGMCLFFCQNLGISA